MRYSIENDTLRLTVDTHGAEAVSVIPKPTGPFCSLTPAS